MKTYRYQCKKCRKVFVVEYPIKEQDEPTLCEECDWLLHRRKLESNTLVPVKRHSGLDYSMKDCRKFIGE